jgi:Flp pilus assembly protein TadG
MRAFRRLVPELGRDTGGSALIETALALLVAIPLLFAVFEICMFTYTLSVLGDAARVGVRYAIVHGSDSTICSGPSTGCSDQSGANVVTTVQNYAAHLVNTPGGLTVTVSYPDNSSGPQSRVGVSVTYRYSPFFQNTGSSTLIPMYATGEGRIVY